jgi:hypothetical protein
VKKRRPIWMTKVSWRFPSNENIFSRHPDAFLAATNCAMQVILRRAALRRAHDRRAGQR